ncbi:VOC family protein [Myxococcota bacterium]|nr:VOC family protein [Myxococcota bacterium]
MAAQLAQVCLFKNDGAALRRFCDVVSGQLEIDNGELLSFHMGAATVAHHAPVGDLREDDVLVTLQVASREEVDRIYAQLKRSNVRIDDEPEDTEWGWRIFYYRAARHLVFEVGAPL